jgi:hypothetical protein
MARTSTSKKAGASVDFATWQSPEIIIDGDNTVRDNADQKTLDQRLVRGKFHFYERPGGTLRFSYRRYKGEKITTYILKDQTSYELPWGVVRALEEGSAYFSHNIEMDAKAPIGHHGEREVMVSQKGQPRYSFMADAFAQLG